MNGLTTNNDRRMTVREVAEALSVSERVIQKHAAELGLTENGKTTYLNEVAVTIIKTRISKSGRTDLAHVCEVDNVTTDLEMKQKALEVMQWMAAQVDAEKAARMAAEQKLVALAPKVEAHDALMTSESTMSITNAAKHFGLHPRLHVLPYLRSSGYLTQNELPTQAAIDAGYLVMKEEKCNDGSIRRRAMVEARQLETWRTRVVPQVKRWEARHA